MRDMAYLAIRGRARKFSDIRGPVGRPKNSSQDEEDSVFAALLVLTAQVTVY